MCVCDNYIIQILEQNIIKPCNTNLGLESLIARVDDGFLVIVHSVSAALAWTSGGHWFI